MHSLTARGCPHASKRSSGTWRPDDYDVIHTAGTSGAFSSRGPVFHPITLGCDRSLGRRDAASSVARLLCHGGRGQAKFAETGARGGANRYFATLLVRPLPPLTGNVQEPLLGGDRGLCWLFHSGAASGNLRSATVPRDSDCGNLVCAVTIHQGQVSQSRLFRYQR